MSSEDCLRGVLTEPFMPMQTSHGLDRVPSTKHVNHLSVKKGERYESETYLAQTQILYSRLPFHSLWESGVQKSYINFFFSFFLFFFFFLQSSYPRAQIPVTFHIE